MNIFLEDENSGKESFCRVEEVERPEKGQKLWARQVTCRALEKMETQKWCLQNYGIRMRG